MAFKAAHVLSCPEVSAAKHWANNDSSQVMSIEEQDPNYIRGYIQGFKEKLSGSPKSSNGPDMYIDQDGEKFTSDSFKPMTNGGLAEKPSYMRGYTNEFKAASEMCGMFNQGDD
jgi:hypothetical protein